MLSCVNVFVLQQRLVSRFMVSTVDESSSSSLAGSMSSPSCSTMLGDSSVILPNLPSLSLSKESMDQMELLNNDRTVLEEVEICSVIHSDTEGSVDSIGKKAFVGKENLSSEDNIRKHSSTSTDTIPTVSMDVNYDLNFSESHSQQTEMRGTQSEISMSSSADVYSSKRSSIIDPDIQLGPLEIDLVTYTVPEPSTMENHAIAISDHVIEGTLPQLPETQGQLGIAPVMDGMQLEQDVKNVTITQAVHDIQLSDLPGSEGPSRKTSFISDRSAELDDPTSIPAQLQRCISEIIPSSQLSAYPQEQQQETNIQASPPPPASQTSTSQVVPGMSQTPSQQYTPENTITPAVLAASDQQALLMHPRLSQQNSLEKDR